MKYIAKEIGLIVLLAVIYFSSVGLATAALATLDLAVRAGLIAAMIAVFVYIVLVFLQQEEDTRTVALLFLAPITILALAALWWALRLVGLWEI